MRLEHMPPVAMRMLNGALTSLAGNVADSPPRRQSIVGKCYYEKW